MTAAAKDGSGIYATKIIKIVVKFAESITIEGNSEVTGATQYVATVLPDYTTNKEVDWSVSDSSVATVDRSGIVTPIKNGIITLTATAKDGSGVTATKEIYIMLTATLTSITSDIGVWDRDFNALEDSYFVYVDKATSQIKLTANFAKGTLKMNGSLAIKNTAKTISLNEDTTVITLSLKGESGDESLYTVTVIKSDAPIKSCATSTDKGYSFNVVIDKGKIDSFESAVLIVNLYDDGKFIGFSKVPVSKNDTIIPVSIETEDTAKSAKLMLWADENTLKPLCQSEECGI